MKIRKITALILALVMACAVLSACGSSEADKAYDKWATDSLPKVETAKAAYDTALAQAVADSDLPGARDAMQTFIDVIKPITASLEAVDMSKLTGVRKTEVPPMLDALKANLAGLEAEHQAVVDKIAENMAGMEDADQGAGEEEYTDAEYDEEEYLEEE